MRFIIHTLLPVLLAASISQAQTPSWMPDPTQQQTYTLHRASSRESTGANADSRTVTPGQTLTILDADGPGVDLAHLVHLDDPEPYHLKRIVLRMYWDGEENPSVETPIGDFFGLGNGDLLRLAIASPLRRRRQSPELLLPHALRSNTPASPSPTKASRHFRTSTGTSTTALDSHPLPAGTLYFHAEYRQAQPNHGWSEDWYNNGDPHVNYRRNLDGKDNYEWFEAKGHGQFIGVTMSILQNQDGWWGEGNDMFFIDDATTPSIVGTGSEDYFLGAWDFGVPAHFLLHGAPVVGKEVAGSRSSVYRFHLDSPIPFTKSMKPASSTATPTTAPTTTTPSPTGINPSRTSPFPRSPRWASASQRCNS